MKVLVSSYHIHHHTIGHGNVTQPAVDGLADQIVGSKNVSNWKEPEPTINDERKLKNVSCSLIAKSRSSTHPDISPDKAVSSPRVGSVQDLEIVGLDIEKKSVK